MWRYAMAATTIACLAASVGCGATRSQSEHLPSGIALPTLGSPDTRIGVYSTYNAHDIVLDALAKKPEEVFETSRYAVMTSIPGVIPVVRGEGVADFKHRRYQLQTIVPALSDRRDQIVNGNIVFERGPSISSTKGWIHHGMSEVELPLVAPYYDPLGGTNIPGMGASFEERRRYLDASLADVQTQGDQELHAVTVHKYHVRLDLALPHQLNLPVKATGQFDIDLWVDAQDRARKVVINNQYSQFSYEVWDPGIPVSIAVPT